MKSSDKFCFIPHKLTDKMNEVYNNLFNGNSVKVRRSQPETAQEILY